MVEQSYGNVSMSLSRSSSFYLEKNELLLMQAITTTKADLAATPTGSPDEYDEYDDDTTDGLKRKQSTSSLFYRNKLSESFTHNQEQPNTHPMFKVGNDDDYDDDELMLDTRLLLHTSVSVENKLNMTLTAPIEMHRMKKVQSNSSDMGADLSSTLKESNMVIGSTSSSSSSSESLGSLIGSVSIGKKKNSGRKRRQKKRESQGSFDSSKDSNSVNNSDSTAVNKSINTKNMIPINVRR